MTRGAQLDLLPGCVGVGACPKAEDWPCMPAAPICCPYDASDVPSYSSAGDGDDAAPAPLAAGPARPGEELQGDGPRPEGEASPPAPTAPGCGELRTSPGLLADEDEGGSGPPCHSVPLPAPRQWRLHDPGAPPGLEPRDEVPSPDDPKKDSVQAGRTPLSSKAWAYVPAASPEKAAARWRGGRQAPRSRSVQGRTTVMMRNLPYCYTRQMLIDLLDSKGFWGEYDFLYLPIDFESGYHVGYAFVNLTLSEHAVRFMEIFNGFNDWTPRRDNRICEVSWGSIQGFHANVERFETKQLVMEGLPERCKPVVFIDGVQHSFHTFVECKQQLKEWMDRKLGPSSFYG